MTDTWKLLARWSGGTVAALTVAGSGTRVLAATAAGLHTSDNGGRSWQWVALGPDPVPEALLASPTFDPSGTMRTVLLGSAAGLFRSTDGGMTWRPVLVGSRVQALAADGDVASAGVVFAGTAADGILRSDDGGSTWDGANAGLLDLDVTALALAPEFGRDRTVFAGTASGLYRSRNGGRAWRLVELDVDAPVIQTLAVSPDFANDGLVLAGTETDGLFRSDDGGQSWEPVDGFPQPCVTALAFVRQASGQDNGRPVIVAGTAAGVAVSEDGGASWRVEATDAGPILALAATTPRDAGAAMVLAGTVGDGVLSRGWPGTDEVWAPANTGLAGRATVGLAASTSYGEVPLVGVAMLDGGAHLSHDAGQTWKSGFAGLPDGSVSSVAFVRTTAGQPRLLATCGGALYRSSDIEGGWQQVAIGGDEGGAATARLTFVQAIGDAGAGTSLALVGGGSLLGYSEDGGDTWQMVPPPTPDAEIVSAASSPDLPRDRTLYAVVRATLTESDGTVVANGLELWHTDSLGARWTRWLHEPTATVMPLAVARTGDLPSTVLVGAPGRVRRPLARSQERRGGEVRPLWQETRLGEPHATVTALALSPRVGADHTVLAAVGGTVHLSRDGGQTFTVLDDGPDAPLVTALALVGAADGRLHAYALGLGGTLWHRIV